MHDSILHAADDFATPEDDEAVEVRLLEPFPARIRVELERETDGRWFGEVRALPGALAYGRTCAEALAAVQALALRILADRLEHGEAA